MPKDLLFVPAFMAAKCCPAFFAQSPTAGIDLTDLIGNLGVMSILAWFLYYHTTNTYPKMQDKFAAEVEKIREAFKEENTELRNMLIQTLASMRVAVHDVKDCAQTVINKVGAEHMAASREAARAEGRADERRERG